MSMPTGIGRLTNGPQIYAPHGYDSVVDSDRYEAFSKENVERLYAGKRQTQERLACRPLRRNGARSHPESSPTTSSTI